MNPKSIKFNGLKEFIEIIQDFPNHEWLFRGQPRLFKNGGQQGAMVLPQPKAGRKEYFLDKRDYNLDRFKRWSHQAIAFFPELPTNDFERLACARHYGLATRLLDWTLNAAVALFFATETAPSSASQKDDGGVFIYRRPSRQIELVKDKLGESSAVMFYAPRPIVPRIMAQDGVFTIHPHPLTPLEARFLRGKQKHNRTEKDLIVLQIPASKKRNFQEDLRGIGILGRSVYPDLEGLSDSINLVTNWKAHPRKQERQPPLESEVD